MHESLKKGDLGQFEGAMPGYLWGTKAEIEQAVGLMPKQQSVMTKGTWYETLRPAGALIHECLDSAPGHWQLWKAVPTRSGVRCPNCGSKLLIR